MNGNYIKISRKMLEWDIYKDKKAFMLLIYLLIDKDCNTNSLQTTYCNLSIKLSMQEEDVKKKLFKLKDAGTIEIYRGNFKKQIIIALRKNEEYYEIEGIELRLDNSLIISIPKKRNRNDKGYDKFRKEVLKRDNYTCQLCGKQKNLEVHHKKSYAKYPRLRTVVSNGITCCKSCHKNLHRKKVQ